MAVSQNGLLANDRSLIHTLTVPGTTVRLPVRKGPVGDLLVWAAARWHREVEPLIPGTCWAYAERTIRGSATVLSNHASGSAIDLNAPKHPLGVPASRNLSPAQIDRVHRIIDDAQGCLRWGGDYDNPARGGVKGSRPDPMHIEVVASEARCAAVLGQNCSPQDSEDDLTPDERKMLTEIHAALPYLVGVYHQMSGSPKLNEWPGWETWAGGTNERLTLVDLARRGNVETRQLVFMLDALRKEVAELRKKFGV